jgi:hypothetical protein
MREIKQLAKRITSLEKRVAQIEAGAGRKMILGTARKKDSKDLSVKEFIISKRPSGDVQKTLAMGYYLEKFEKVISFNIEDLGRCFQLAKEPTPQNINDKINMNIRKGHMAEAKQKKNNKKAWIVTNTGEQFLENGFKDIKK